MINENLMIELIHKDKIRADNYISVLLILSYCGFLLFFRLEWLLSMLVYPLVALFFYGIIKIINGNNKRNRGNVGNLNRILLGVVSIIFSTLMLNFILRQPNVTLQTIINLTAFPLMIVGIAGIIKGSIIKNYSLKYCNINIVIGIMTIVVCILAFLSPAIIPQDFILIHTITLSITLLVNILGRAALYLSEYGLSLLHIRNFILFFYITSDYLNFIDPEGNAILEKIK